MNPYFAHTKLNNERSTKTIILLNFSVIIIYCYKILTCLKRPVNWQLTLIAIIKFNIGQTEIIILVYEHTGGSLCK